VLASSCGGAPPSEAEDDPGPLLVGSGEYVYEWNSDWARLPAGESLGPMHGQVAVDARGRVYVQTESGDAVRVFDADGEFLYGFGAELAGGLHGIAVAREGEVEVLYLTHIVKGEVYKATLEGEVLMTLGWPQESGLYEGAEQYHPTAVAVASNGELFVADGYGLSYVHRYDRAGQYLASFGGQGRELGQLRNPHGLWIEERDGREVLLVADRENRRLVGFELDGRPLGAWREGVRRPCFVQPREGLYAMADIDGKVSLFDAAGALLTHLGENPDPDQRDRADVPLAEITSACFVSPHGLAWAPDGSLYVVEWLEEGRVTKLVPSSRP